MKEENYFVKIDEHNDVLKAVLQSSKLAITSSQSYYKLLEIRREKTELFFQLRAQVVELFQHAKFLEEELPHSDLIKKQTLPKKKPVVKKTNSDSVKKSPKKKTSSNELSKLAETLASIEEKIQSLN